MEGKDSWGVAQAAEGEGSPTPSSPLEAEEDGAPTSPYRHPPEGRCRRYRPRPAPPSGKGVLCSGRQGAPFPPGQSGWTTAQRSARGRQTQQPQNTTAPRPVEGLALGERRFVFVRSEGRHSPCVEADVKSAVARAFYKEGVPAHIRILSLSHSAKGTLAGLFTPFAPTEQLLQYRGTILRAAQTVDAGIVDITKYESRERVKVHGIPLARYIGEGSSGLEKLREWIESENGPTSRWRQGGWDARQKSWSSPARARLKRHRWPLWYGVMR